MTRHFVPHREPTVHIESGRRVYGGADGDHLLTSRAFGSVGFDLAGERRGSGYIAAVELIDSFDLRDGAETVVKFARRKTNDDVHINQTGVQTSSPGPQRLQLATSVPPRTTCPNRNMEGTQLIDERWTSRHLPSRYRPKSKASSSMCYRLLPSGGSKRGDFPRNSG